VSRKNSIFQPLRRADGSNLLKSAALAAAVAAASILFQAQSRTPESPVATSSAASGTATRALSGTGPQTIMKKS
jgi:ABC-type phosphate transport system substrate-binding protein